MRKILLLPTTVFLFIFSPAFNQTTEKQKVSLGIKTGVDISKLKLNGKIPGIMESHYRTGFVAGAFVNFPFGKSPISLQPEFLYSSMGGDLQNEFHEKQNIRL